MVTIQLFYTFGFSGRVVVRLDSTADDYALREGGGGVDPDRRGEIVNSFVPRVVAYYRAASQVSPGAWELPSNPHMFYAVPRDFLLVYNTPVGFNQGSANADWPEEMGEPAESGVRMAAWWEEAAKDSPLQSYYHLLEGCEWTVWRVRNPQMEGRHLRVMLRTGGGDKRLGLAVHFQVVGDEGGL